MRIAIYLPLLLLIGCSHYDAEAMLQNYTSRLERVLEVSIAPEPSPEIPAFPFKRDRKVVTAELREGLLDVLDLRRCGLVSLIAERNSSLGKVFQPSKKLVYELQFFDKIRQCREQIAQDTAPENDELKQRIELIYQVKSENLAAEIWNGIFTSPAIEINFSKGEPALALDSTGAEDASLQAFNYLAQIAALADQQQWQLPDLSNIESHYHTLFSNRSGAQVLTSLASLTVQLNHASTLIEKRLAKRPMCYNNQANPQAKIMQNVFFKFYIGEVQLYLAKTHQFSRAWRLLVMQTLEHLRQAGLTPPPHLETYIAQTWSENNSLWAAYNQARDRHTQAWQEILGQCGMMPNR